MAATWRVASQRTASALVVRGGDGAVALVAVDAALDGVAALVCLISRGLHT
jgi:hypothetical protein